MTGPSARAERLPVRQFTTIDGLAHNHINRIKIDADGFLWFCTDNGISRFDGRQFFTLTAADGIPHPDVNDVVQDKQGAFWMATDGGIARLQLRSPGTNDRPVIETFRSAEHPSDHYDAIELDPAGRLWAGGHEGLYEVERNPGGVVLRHRNEGLPRAPVARPRSSPTSKPDSSRRSIRRLRSPPGFARAAAKSGITERATVRISCAGLGAMDGR